MKKLVIIVLGAMACAFAQAETDSDYLCTNKRLFEAGKDSYPSKNIKAYSSCQKNDLILVDTNLMGALCTMEEPITLFHKPPTIGEFAYCRYRGSPRKVRNNQEDQIRALEVKEFSEKFDRQQKKLREMVRSNKD